MANRAQIHTSNSALIAMIADEDTVVGFLLAGVGNVDLRRKTNYLIVDSKTTIKQIEDAFKEFTTREDIAVVLISQYTGEICLDILKNAWSPAWTLQSVCRAIIALMAHPEPDSPLNCDSGNLLRSGDIRGYQSMARMYTRLAAMPKKG